MQRILVCGTEPEQARRAGTRSEVGRSVVCVLLVVLTIVLLVFVSAQDLYECTARLLASDCHLRQNLDAPPPRELLHLRQEFVRRRDSPKGVSLGRWPTKSAALPHATTA